MSRLLTVLMLAASMIIVRSSLLSAAYDVLGIWAHMDDETIFMGETIANYVHEEGKSVKVYTFINHDISAPWTEQERIFEVEHALVALGLNIIDSDDSIDNPGDDWQYLRIRPEYWSDYAYDLVETYHEESEANMETWKDMLLAEMIREHPQVVYTHDRMGLTNYHPEHLLVHDVVTMAFREYKKNHNATAQLFYCAPQDWNQVTAFYTRQETRFGGGIISIPQAEGPRDYLTQLKTTALNMFATQLSQQYVSDVVSVNYEQFVRYSAIYFYEDFDPAQSDVTEWKAYDGNIRFEDRLLILDSFDDGATFHEDHTALPTAWNVNLSYRVPRLKFKVRCLRNPSDIDNPSIYVGIVSSDGGLICLRYQIPWKFDIAPYEVVPDVYFDYLFVNLNDLSGEVIEDGDWHTIETEIQRDLSSGVGGSGRVDHIDWIAVRGGMEVDSIVLGFPSDVNKVLPEDPLF
jgi:LmbE family N-acetylglucosaminyl deacetylase